MPVNNSSAASVIAPFNSQVFMCVLPSAPAFMPAMALFLLDQQMSVTFFTLNAGMPVDIGQVLKRYNVGCCQTCAETGVFKRFPAFAFKDKTSWPSKPH